MISKEYLYDSMSRVDLPDQIKILEEQLTESGIQEFSDVLAFLLLPIMLDMDGGQYPAELVARVKKLAEQVNVYNQGR